ncbi:MAG: EthD domain-containing protein [Pseudomonadales bacterium]|jgi:uncharacterized protein (TIGR02118 family)
MNMELIAAFKDSAQAREVATKLNGTLYVDERENTDHLPFAALVSAQTDELAALIDAADVGTYLVCRRIIKPRQQEDVRSGQLPGIIGLFTMVANSNMGPQLADRHWRDNHAPLALEVHKAMSFYYQLSVQHVFKGPDWNGFAMCGFDNIDDLRHRFFDTPEGEKAIAVDVAKFSDGKRSPRRTLAVEIRFG